MSADEIIGRCGLKPKFTQSAGQPRQTPRGNALEGIYSRTYVSFPLDTSHYGSIEECLADIGGPIGFNDEITQALLVGGGRIEIFIGVYCENNCGIELPPALMARLADKKMFLSLDIYGNAGTANADAANVNDPQ